MEPRTSCMLSMCSTTALYPPPNKIVSMEILFSKGYMVASLSACDSDEARFIEHFCMKKAECSEY